MSVILSHPAILRIVQAGFSCSLLYKLCWRLVPSQMRRRVSAILEHFYKRAAITVPRSRTWVYALSDENQALFSKSLVPDFISDYYLKDQSSNGQPEFSLITTVLNEASGIESWLDSLAKQTAQPKEVVICDAGSSDGSVERVSKWYEQNKETLEFVLEVFTEPGVNIARGRNLAIKRASCEVLLLTDAGCVLDEHWAEYMLVPFRHRKDTEVVMGWYEPMVKGGFKKEVAKLIVPKLSSIEPQEFLPSARSLAVTKTAWSACGGFPEYLSLAGEDSLFDYFLKKHTTRWAFVPDAVVKWQFPPTLSAALKTISGYARGDAEGGRLHWAHYLWLTKAWLRVCVEEVFLLFFLVAALIFESWLFLLLAFFAAFFWMYRIYEILIPYGVFRGEAGVFSRSRRILAALLVSLAQAAGFTSGLREWKGVERKRVAAAEKGHLLFLSDKPLKSDNPKLFVGEGGVSGILSTGWYVTNVYREALSENGSGDRLLDDYRAELYSIEDFSIELWLAKHKETLGGTDYQFSYVLESEDEKMKTLSEQALGLGAKSFS